MKRYPVFFAIIFFSCHISSKKEIVQKLIPNPETVIEKSKNNFKTNKCFQNLTLNQGEVAGNCIIYKFEGGTFYKLFAKSDTTFVFSCGKDSKEVLIDEFNCNEFSVIPQLAYHSNDLMVFHQNGGSNSWNDYIISFDVDSLYITQAYFVDTIHYRFVELSDELEIGNKKVNFLVHDIRFKNTDTLECKYGKYREGGSPSLHIFDVRLYFDDKKLESKLIYSIELENGSIAKDSVEYK